MFGTLLNVALILVGGGIGLLLRGRLPSTVESVVMHGIGLFTLIMGVQMALATRSPILILISLALGGILGGFLQIEKRLESLAKFAEKRLQFQDPQFTQAFVTTSLLFCVGPMAILGAISDGLRGEIQILLTKGILDGISALAFATTLGAGVLFSAAPVLLYQGGIALTAGLAASLLSDPIIAELSACGGYLIVGLGINLLGIGKIRVGDLLPALLIIPILVALA